MRPTIFFSRLLVAVFLVAAACGDDGDAPVFDASIADAPVGAADGATDAPPGTIDGTVAMPDGAVATPDGPIQMLDGAVLPDDDIRAIQDGTIPEGTAVRIAGVAVTARADGASSTVIFIQEPTGSAAYSGLLVFIDTMPAPSFAIPAVGDLVTVEGTVSEFTRAGFMGSRTNIDPVTDITIDGTAAIPAPAVVPEADLVALEQWEGVLVSVTPATVASSDAFNEFTLTGGLKVDDRLYAYAQPYPGDEYAALIGPLDYDFGTARLYPRGPLDLVGYLAAPPVLTDLSPASISAGAGGTVTYTIVVDRAAPVGGTTIDVGSTSPLVAAPASATAIVPQGATTTTFQVLTLTAGSTDVTASFGGMTLIGALTVISTDPAIVSVTPSPLEVLSGGGTGILTITLDMAAPAGGTSISLGSDDPGVVVPASVVVPEGATSASFRVRGDSLTPASAIVTATLGISSQPATVDLVASAPAPVVGDLALNEINYDVPTTAGDANCDGAISATTDEFIELVNVSAHPVELLNVTLWDAAAWSGAALLRYSFPTFVLGPGEAVVVFGGSLGTTGTSAWCTNLDGSHIGDARAFAGAALGLNNSGTPADTIRVTSGASTLTTELVTALDLPSGTDQAYVRSPDLTGGFVFDGMAPGGAADRNWTPGTRLTARPFADATP